MEVKEKVLQPTVDGDVQNLISFFKEEVVEPFDVDYQNRFLKLFITDKDGFPERIVDIVQVDYFESYQKILLNYEIDFYNKYREIARFNSLRDIVRQKEKGLAKDHLLGLIDKLESTELTNLNHLKDSAYYFFKERSVKNCLFELVKDWKGHNYDSMKIKLENALKAGEPKETGHHYLRDIEKRLERDFRAPIPAMYGLDKYIGGGLAGGEMAIVLAPPGGGKSMALVKIASTALLEGKKAIYYTLELSEKVVGQRFDACLNQIKIKDVWEYPDIVRENAQIIDSKGGQLVIKEFATGQATTNTILAHLRTLEANEGFVPDIIFIDYADIMKPLAIFSEKRHSLTSIYEGIRGIAVELGIPIWTASQTNRAGMNKDKFGLDAIGEALGKAATADLVLGIGRPDEVKVANEATFGILKNRNGSDGFYLPAIFDTHKILIEILPPEETVMVPGNQKSTNKKNEKKKDDDIENINDILMDNDF
jgi:replicative DNA helicase